MNLFKPIIDAFVENGDRYNMLQSGVLELLEYIRKVHVQNYQVVDMVFCLLKEFFLLQEGLKQLIIYANESFWDQLMKFEHFGSIQAFRLKYQQVGPFLVYISVLMRHHGQLQFNQTKNDKMWLKILDLEHNESNLRFIFSELKF